MAAAGLAVVGAALAVFGAPGGGVALAGLIGVGVTPGAGFGGQTGSGGAATSFCGGGAGFLILRCTTGLRVGFGAAGVVAAGVPAGGAP